MIPPNGKYTKDDYDTGVKALKYGLIGFGIVTIIIIILEKMK